MRRLLLPPRDPAAVSFGCPFASPQFAFRSLQFPLRTPLLELCIVFRAFLRRHERALDDNDGESQHGNHDGTAHQRT